MIVLELMIVSFRMIGNLLYKLEISHYSMPFQWNRSIALECARDVLARRVESVYLSCWRLDVLVMAQTI